MSLTTHLGRLLASVRRIAARRPALRWLPVLIAATGLFATVAAHHREVDERRRSWGEPVAVWIASTDLSPGEPLVAERQEVPPIVVPDAALDGSVDVEVEYLRHPIGSGEIVTTHHLVRGSMPSALIPPGWLAVAVAERLPAGAGVGEQVVVAADGLVLAEAAVVIAQLDAGVLVAVPAELAPLVALADGLALLRTGTAPGLSANPQR